MTRSTVRVDAVLVQAVIAGALSFAHLHDLAAAAGQDGWKAWAYPVSVDLLLVAAWRRFRSGGTKAAAWCWFVVALTASLGANVATAGLLNLGTVPAWLRILVAGWPAVAFLGGTLLSSTDLRSRKPHRPRRRTRQSRTRLRRPPRHLNCPLPQRSQHRLVRSLSRPLWSPTHARSPTTTAPEPEPPSTPRRFAPGSASHCRSPKPSPPNSLDPEELSQCARPRSAR